jgi:hypothetical protein
MIAYRLLLRAWRRLFPTRPESGRPGRPVGTGRWRDDEDFEQALLAALKALEVKGRKPTQENVARILYCDPRTLRRWLNEFGVNWAKITRRSLFSSK